MSLNARHPIPLHPGSASIRHSLASAARTSGIVHTSASAPLAAAAPCATPDHVGQQQLQQQSPKPVDRLRETIDHLQLSQKSTTQQQVLPQPQSAASRSPHLPTRQTIGGPRSPQLPTRQTIGGPRSPQLSTRQTSAGCTTPGNYVTLTKSIISSRDAKTQESNYAGSDMNTSVGGTTPSNAFGSPNSGSFEKRLTWLEEDVAVLTQRVKEQFGDDADSAADDTGLRYLVARLEGELAEQRRLREQLEDSMKSMGATMHREQKEHEARLRSLSSELESSIRPLINGIDDGLFSGASFMRERTDNAEGRLRSLMTRMDQSLTASAAPHQDPLSKSLDAQRTIDASMNAARVRITEMSVQRPVVSPWRRSPMESPQVRSRDPSQAVTPTSAAPSAMQVPGDGWASTG